MKNLGAGIHDLDTSKISLKAISDLLSYRMIPFQNLYYTDKDAAVRIVAKEKSVEYLFDDYILQYGTMGKKIG